MRILRLIFCNSPSCLLFSPMSLSGLYRRKMFREEREARIEENSHAVLQSSATAAMPLRGILRIYKKYVHCKIISNSYHPKLPVIFHLSCICCCVTTLISMRIITAGSCPPSTSPAGMPVAGMFHLACIRSGFRSRMQPENFVLFQDVLAVSRYCEEIASERSRPRSVIAGPHHFFRHIFA